MTVGLILGLGSNGQVKTTRGVKTKWFYLLLYSIALRTLFGFLYNRG